MAIMPGVPVLERPKNDGMSLVVGQRTPEFSWVKDGARRAQVVEGSKNGTIAMSLEVTTGGAEQHHK